MLLIGLDEKDRKLWNSVLAKSGEGIDIQSVSFAEIEKKPDVVSGTEAVVMAAKSNIKDVLNFLSNIQTIMQATSYAIVCSKISIQSMQLDIQAHIIDPEINYETGIKNYITDLKVSTGHEEIKGDIGTMSCIELVENFCRQGRSKQFEITHREGTAVLILRNGQVYHCSIGSLQGPDAFDMVIGWNYGTFQTKPVDLDQHSKNIEETWESLLLNAVRKKDESSFLRKAAPL